MLEFQTAVLLAAGFHHQAVQDSPDLLAIINSKKTLGIVERSASGAVPPLGFGQVGRLIPLLSDFSVSFSDHQNSKNPSKDWCLTDHFRSPKAFRPDRIRGGDRTGGRPFDNTELFLNEYGEQLLYPLLPLMTSSLWSALSGMQLDLCSGRPKAREFATRRLMFQT